MTSHTTSHVLQRLTRLAPRHGLHRFSVVSTSLFALMWFALYGVAGSVTPVQQVRLRCVAPLALHRSERLSKSERPSESILEHQERSTADLWDIISWDLSRHDAAQALRARSEIYQERVSEPINSVNNTAAHQTTDPLRELVIPMIRRARSRALRDERPLAIQLQGVSRSALARLEVEMITRGGCWTSVSLVSAPRWVRWLRARGLNLPAILVGADADTLADERALWTGVWGVRSGTSPVITAERWALPAPPARWPARWFQPRPAALAVTISSDGVESGESVQLINLQLPAALHKHQSGALGLRALQRPPLSQRQGDRWLIMGDWQVQPDAHEAHPSAGFRFQRFSIEALYRDRSLTLVPTPQDAVERWGRWRSEGQPRHPAIIDYALSSSGALKLRRLPQQSSLWVGQLIQRAPLWVSWRPARLTLE